MTTRTTLQSYLPTALFTLLETPFVIADAADVYFDTATRWERSGTEVLLTWGGRRPASVPGGRFVISAVNIQLFKATHDAIQLSSKRLEDLIEAAARLIMETYDEQEPLFAGVLSTVVDSVRVFEKTSVDAIPGGEKDPRNRFIQEIGLEITALED